MLLCVLLVALMPTAALPSDAQHDPDQRLLHANRLLYEGSYVAPAEDNALGAYEKLLQDDREDIKIRARAGIARILRLAAHYARKDDADRAWKLADPVLRIKDAGLEEALRTDAQALGQALFENARKAEEAGRCSEALRQAGRALKAAPDHSDAKTLLGKIRSNPGTLTVLTLHGGWLVVDGKRTKETVPTRKYALVCGSHTIEVVNPDNPAQPRQKTRVEIRPKRETKIQFSGSEARILD